jgi:hypothetical protein
MMTDSNGLLRVIDHGAAFANQLLVAESSVLLENNFAGWKLPERYTSTFVNQLRQLSEATLITRYRNLISDQSIRLLLIRRRIILEDIRLRGDSAIISSPSAPSSE